MNDSTHENITPSAVTPPASTPPDGTPGRRRHRVLVGAAIATAAVVGLGGTGLSTALVVGALSDLGDRISASSTTTTAAPDTLRFPGGGREMPSLPSQGGSGSAGTGQGDASTDATASTAAEQEGVVTILTTLNFDDDSHSAGTGMVLSADGLVLTNNHVIESSTGIEVTVESTGVTYSAEVVGTDDTNDVALLQLVDENGRDVSGLDPIETDADETVAAGDAIYSVGNASGTGDLVTAAGVVTATDVAITVGSGYTGTTEDLGGLIQLDSDVVSGDSGGPLFDDDGEVVGIVTAASSGSADITGYAIDIDLALDIVEQIESGVESGTVQIGSSAFLGIQLSGAAGTTTAGAPVGGAIAGMPAAGAGIAAGSTITTLDGVAIASADALSAAVAEHEPGDSVSIGWTDAAGVAQSAALTLVAGPA